MDNLLRSPSPASPIRDRPSHGKVGLENPEVFRNQPVVNPNSKFFKGVTYKFEASFRLDLSKTPIATSTNSSPIKDQNSNM